MRDIPTSSRIAQIKRNRSRRRLRLSILFFLLFVSIIGGLSYFSAHPKITINKIIITGNSIIDSKEVESRIYEDLSGRYLKLFARSNFLLYPHDKIFNDLVMSFSRIESLKVSREGINTLQVIIKERSGSYLYCGTVLPEIKNEIGENCYFVNNDGLIFDKAPYFSGNVYFKYYVVVKENKGSPLGSQVFGSNQFHSLARFIDGVTLLGFKPIYLVVGDDGIYSLYLKSSGNNPNPKIIFKEDNDLINILENFSTAMSKKEFKDEINGKYDMLSYIDLRFKNKVLYKFE